MHALLRVAHLTDGVNARLKKRADQIAQRIERAEVRNDESLQRYDNYATELERTADEMDAMLGQISNMPPLQDSPPSSPQSGDDGK